MMEGRYVPSTVHKFLHLDFSNPLPEVTHPTSVTHDAPLDPAASIKKARSAPKTTKRSVFIEQQVDTVCMFDMQNIKDRLSGALHFMS